MYSKWFDILELSLSCLFVEFLNYPFLRIMANIHRMIPTWLETKSSAYIYLWSLWQLIRYSKGEDPVLPLRSTWLLEDSWTNNHSVLLQGSRKNTLSIVKDFINIFWSYFITKTMLLLPESFSCRDRKSPPPSYAVLSRLWCGG